MCRLFSFKITRDTGFAPNPFWGRLTLATCKPRIRASKRPSNWIAGFTSRSLSSLWFLSKVHNRSYYDAISFWVVEYPIGETIQ